MQTGSNKLKRINSLPGDERGFLLIITMMILVVLTVLGMAALDNSVFELRISNNDRFGKVAFNLADGSVYSSSKLITEAMEASGDPAIAGVAYSGFTITKNDGTGASVVAPHAADDFYRVAMGFELPKPERQRNGDAPFAGADFNDPENNPAAFNVPDFILTPPGGAPNQSVSVTITGRESKMIAGGGAEFGAGAAGAGVGSGGAGAAVTFDVDVTSFAAINSRASLSARYRKVLGSTGGL